MSKMYGSYSDDELNYWERLPANVIVLTSSAFGAWLLRRDENKRKQENTDLLDKITAEIRHFMYIINPSSSESDYACYYILQIIDKYKAESED